MNPGAAGPTSEEAIRSFAKRELRRRMIAIRKATPKDARARRSQDMSRRVQELPEFSRATCIAGFFSVRSEIDPHSILVAAWERGNTVCLPRVDIERNEVVFHACDQTTELVQGAFGISEPPPSRPEIPRQEIDFVLVPALAVDPRGHRVGYGKGFYDRLLETLTGAFSCAVAFEFQLISEAPNTSLDVAVHCVVTDKRSIRVSS